MSKGENIFQRKDGRREARHSKGYELPAVPPVRQLLRRVAARKADGGVRRENARKRRVFQPAPDVFDRGAKSAICGERGMGRFSAVLLWAGRSRARRGILGAPVWAEQSPAPTVHQHDTRCLFIQIIIISIS